MSYPNRKSTPAAAAAFEERARERTALAEKHRRLETLLAEAVKILENKTLAVQSQRVTSFCKRARKEVEFN